LLINGIFTIKREIKEFDLLGMTLHAVSFGIFLLSVLIMAVAGMLWLIHPTNRTYVIYDYASLVYIYMSFVSLILLCRIFWVISTKKKAESADEAADTEQPFETERASENRVSTVVEVKVEDFDASDEIQLRIWQYFVRGRQDTNANASELMNQNLSHDAQPVLMQDTMIQTFEEDN